MNSYNVNNHCTLDSHKTVGKKNMNCMNKNFA